ncbi:zinc finger and BTB domain-containing protein 1 [Perca flavescens]|uniref:zinc finger and BTB domain-containing protein 1 n=1 Tax=Perca flavescens TaxID=8167 RepID=UPI00106E428F|nr:zinc finger and BTB domain-containing protein 1-like [Perca flavescens]
MARPSHSDHVLQQLNNQREWGFLCDCLIAIGDIYFRAHKAVLAACSSYFRMTFIREQQAAGGGGGGRLDLSNMAISAECFDLILQLMYLGRIVVGGYEFEELKASMATLQMYYIPDSLDDLRDIRSANITPSSTASSSSSSSSAGGGAVAAGKMMFGVRMYEQQRAAGEGGATAERRGAGGRMDLVEPKAVQLRRAPVCKGEDEAERDGEPGGVCVKTEPEEENAFAEIEVVRGTLPGALSGGEPLDGGHAHVPSGDDSGIPAKLRRVKEEKPEQQDGGCAPCELCGAALTEENKSAHYLSDHMGNICACGRCLARSGHSPGYRGESDSPGEDEASLPEDPSGADGAEEGDLACPHCGALFQSESLALEHTLSCHEELFRPPLLEDGTAAAGGEPDHRRKHFCSICGKGFYQRCHLREHYTVHTKEKQFSCQTCGKQFLRERQLRLHTDMHRGMARYVCPVCDQGTFLKHDHVRHMISHLAAGETICQVCFQIFPGGEQLEKHMDVHLYICGVCGEKFRLRKDMRSHYNAKHTKRL